MDGMSWTDSVLDTSGGWWMVTVDVGAHAGLLATVVLAINLMFRRWLNAGQMGLLWGLVLLRLVIPLVPSSSLSLDYLVAPDANQPQVHQTALAPTAGEPAAAARTAQYYSSPLAHRNPSPTVPESNWFWNGLETLLDATPLIWLIVGAIGFAYALINYARFCARVNCTTPCDDPRLLRLWAECRELAGVKRSGSIVRFDCVEQPAIMGVLRPTLLLPTSAADLDDDQLKMVMLHELAHVRRWDIASNWGLVVIRAIHWWNPVYWLAASRFRSLREQACDAFVIRKMQGSTAQSYGGLLLKLAERRPTATTWQVMLPASILNFFPTLFRRRAVRVRLKALRRATANHGRFQAAAVAALLAALIITGFTVAREEVEKPMDLPTWMASHPDAVLASQRSYEVRPIYAGPWETREYEVTRALQAIRDEAESCANGGKRDPMLDSGWLLEITLKQMFSHVHRDDPPGGSVNSEVAPSGDKTAADHKAKSLSPTFKVTGKTLSATAPATMHDFVRRMLDVWGESGMAQISIETRFLHSNRDLVSDLGVSWQFMEAFSPERETTFPIERSGTAAVVRAQATVDEYLPLVVATLNEQQRSRLVQIAHQERNSNLLIAPKITIFNGTEAMLADCSQRPFVVGMLERRSGATEPKIVVIEEGTKMKIRAVVGQDRKKIHIAAGIDMKSIGDVTTASTSYRGTPVTIQVPSVNRRSVDVAGDIEDGKTLLVGFIPTEKQKRYLYLLISAQTVADVPVPAPPQTTSK